MLVELVAVSLAVVLAGLAAAQTSGRIARERRRARALCASCGRRVIQKQPTCDCD